VELTRGREGFDFLGCHLHKRMSGPMWERYGKTYYFLNRWPSERSMKRIRQRVRALTGRSRDGVKDVRELIGDLNPVLRGWANYFRTGNAATKLGSLDDYVERRLYRFLVKRKGWHLRPGQARVWTRDFFEGHGLVRRRGTIRYPRAA
jgi:RNA-directed DNA polymerase